MKETSYGLGFVQVMFMMAIIAIVAYIAMWVAVGLCALWFLWYLGEAFSSQAQTTAEPAPAVQVPAVYVPPQMPAGVAPPLTPPPPLPASPAAPALGAAPRPQVSWPMLIAPLAAGGAMLAILLEWPPGVSLWLGLIALGLVAASFFIPRPASNEFRLGVRLVAASAAAAVIFTAITMYSDRPVPVVSEDYVHTGSATTMEEAWLNAECLEGTTADQYEIPWILEQSDDAFLTGACMIDDEQEQMTAFILFGSVDDLNRAIDNGDITLERDALGQHPSFTTDGLLLSISTDVYGTNHAYEDFRIDD